MLRVVQFAAEPRKKKNERRQDLNVRVVGDGPAGPFISCLLEQRRSERRLPGVLLQHPSKDPGMHGAAHAVPREAGDIADAAPAIGGGVRMH